MDSINTTNQSVQRTDAKPRYVIIGGFPGAGKTAAAAKFGAYLRSRSLNVGIITNDHGQALVDTATLRSQGFDSDELDGGCLSVQFDRFTEAANELMSAAELDVLIAEPAGTCTDVNRTVSYPLQTSSGKELTLSPLSIVVDPIRANRILGLDGGPRFSEKLLYIYRKQLEEADFIAINKIDLISESKLELLSNVLKKNHPRAQIFHVSARTGEGLAEWFDCIMRHEQKARDGIDVDSTASAEGAGLLGWLNCSVHLSSVKYWESGRVLMELASTIQNFLRSEAGEVAHLKMALTPDEDMGTIAVMNLVGSDSVPELLQKLPEPVQSGELLLNLRAEADPELLHATVNRALLVLVDRHPELFARLEHCEHFRPGKARPAESISTFA